MKNRRILHLSDSLPGGGGTVGGAEIIAGRLIKLFSALPWEQAVATTYQGKGEELQNIQQFSLPCLEDTVQLPWLTPLKSQLLPFDPLVHEGLEDLLSQFKPGVVLFHTTRRLPLGLTSICRAANVPVVVVIYDYIHFCPTEMFVDNQRNLCRRAGERCLECHPQQAKSLVAWSEHLLPLRSRLFEPLLKKVTSFVTLSHSSAELLYQQGIDRERISVIPQPLPDDIDVGQTEIDADSILFIGWGQERKGLLVIARALKELKRPFRFQAVGTLVDSEYIEKVREALIAADIEPESALLGRVSNERLRKLRAKAGIVVLAEQWENMSPAVLHESMALGKVVIAGDIGGIGESVDHGVNGYLVQYDQPKAYAEVLQSLLGNHQKLHQIGVNARNKAQENCNQNLVVQRWRHLLEKMFTEQPDEEVRSWLRGVPCVIVCGGQGSRLGKSKGDLPKSLVPIAGVPILRLIMDFWAPYVSRFILIIGKKTLAIKEYSATLPYDVQCCCEEKEGRGVAAALLEAEPLVSGRFLMVLGDCIYRGPIHVPPGMDRGVGIFPGAGREQIKENYSVELTADGRIKQVIEKPVNPQPSAFCGMGAYFLDGAVWNAIRETGPDSRGVIQITDVVQTMIDKVGVFPVRFEGSYNNINCPSDLDVAEKMLMRHPQVGR